MALDLEYFGISTSRKFIPTCAIIINSLKREALVAKMPGKVEPRNVAPFLQAIRSFLLGRKPTNALRFADFIAARTQPPPNIPEGSAHKLSANYYYSRDGRREVKPPLVVGGGPKLLESGKEDSNVPARKGTARPGNVWHWD